MSAFEGSSVIVTGGASGIGLTTARAFASEGARVAVLDLQTGTADGDLGHGIVAVSADVTDRACVDAAVAAVVARFGGIDILVNNAGISAIGTVEETPDADWARVLDVNVTGMARVSAASLPYLRRSSHAAIVNLCSIAALNGLPQRALYAASKGAVLSLTFAMATDHIAEGIRVNAVSPGTVFTPSSRTIWRGSRTRSESERCWMPVRPPAGWSRPTTSPRRSCTSPVRAPDPRRARRCRSMAA